MDLIELITKLKTKIKITQVLDHFEIEYEEQPARFRIICPFHDDEHPSLIIYTDNEDETDTFWCPPCSLTGDSFELIRLLIRHKQNLDLSNKKDFSESLKILKKLSGYVDDGKRNDFREDIDEKFKKPSKKEKDPTKAYYYACGTKVRDAVKDKIFTIEQADKIFMKIDEHINKNLEIEKVKEFYTKIVDLIQKRKK